jgi:CelD/BcsL family acetyltransferase involved in cellulose biosynthesis
MATSERFDRAGLAPLISGWEDLAAHSAALPMQDAPYSAAAAEAFDGESEVVVVGDVAAPDAVAPLVRRGRQLELLGLDELHEPTDLLARSPDALEALLAELLRARRPLALMRIPAGSETIPALRRVLGRRGYVRLRPVVGCPTMKLGEQWREPGGGLSSSRRSALRRARRRAEASGEIAIELARPAPGEVDALLDEAFAVEARSWKGSAGTAVSHDPRLERFYRHYAGALAERRALRVELLRIDGAAVAMQIAVEWQERIWLLKIGYDEQHAAASPGQLLLAESVADAARRDLAAYELLGTPAGWTEPWAPELRECVSVVAYPPGAASAAVLGARAARVAAKRARSRAGATLRATERIAASRYVAGPQQADALREDGAYRTAGFETTVGFWYDDNDDARAVKDQCLADAAAVAPGGQLSVKPPGFGNDAAFAAELIARARERQLGVHFDALQPETAEPVLALAAQLAADAGGQLGCTLPGRWPRSIADARLAIEHGLRVRIVKSEWPHPDDPDRDPREGCLEVVEALAGQAAHVAIATHDPKFAEPALRRLVETGTPCEQQVLHGVRATKVVAVARRLGVPVRVYVPYGTGRVPYPAGDLNVHLRHVARLASDVVPRPRPRVRG